MSGLIDDADSDGLWPSARWEGALADEVRLWGEVEQRLLMGDSLKRIAKDRGFPVLRFAAWVGEDVGRAGAYERLLRLRADELAHEALEMANTPMDGVTFVEKTGGKYGDQTETTHADMLGHRKLVVDTNLRLAAKWDRERYGEKLDVKHSGGVPSLTIVINEAPLVRQEGRVTIEQAERVELPAVAEAPHDLI